MSKGTKRKPNRGSERQMESGSLRVKRIDVVAGRFVDPKARAVDVVALCGVEQAAAALWRREISARG